VNPKPSDLDWVCSVKLHVQLANAEPHSLSELEIGFVRHVFCFDLKLALFVQIFFLTESAFEN
jgi:hypothetical protein